MYAAHVIELMNAESEAIFEEKWLQLRKNWSKPFAEYFETRIAKNRSSFGAWVPEIKQIKQDLGLQIITSNQSEGFNFLLKRTVLQKWNEVPVDKLLHGVHLLQNFYLQEIRRGYAGLGEYMQIFEFEWPPHLGHYTLEA